MVHGMIPNQNLGAKKKKATFKTLKMAEAELRRDALRCNAQRSSAVAQMGFNVEVDREGEINSRLSRQAQDT